MKRLDSSTIIEIFKRRYACKKFDASKSIADSDFATILESGRLSPRSFGFEPWHFVVLQNKTERQKTLREKLKQSVWGGIHALDSASHVVILLARKRADLLPHSDYLHNVMANVHKIPTEGIQLRRDYFANFGEKEWGFLNDDAATFAWSARQCYIALGNMMTTAAALNIDSCAIEGFNLKETSTLLEKENVLDSHHFGLAVMVGFGFAGEPPKHEKTRTPIEKISTFL